MQFDRGIIDSFKKGNLEPFYSHTYPAMLIYAKRLLGAGYEMYAEDCVQNAIYKTWNKRDIFSESSSPITFRAYIYRCIFNEIMDIKRAKFRFNKFAEQSTDTPEFFNSVIEQEVTIAIIEAIKKLPQKEREVIELSYFKGLKNSEIEEKLGISLSTVKRYKKSALDFLRKNILETITILISIMHNPSPITHNSSQFTHHNSPITRHHSQSCRVKEFTVGRSCTLFGDNFQ